MDQTLYFLVKNISEGKPFICIARNSSHNCPPAVNIFKPKIPVSPFSSGADPFCALLRSCFLVLYFMLGVTSSYLNFSFKKRFDRPPPFQLCPDYPSKSRSTRPNVKYPPRSYSYKLLCEVDSLISTWGMCDHRAHRVPRNGSVKLDCSDRDFCSIRCYSRVSGAQVWKTGLGECIELGLRFLTV